jgi:hypothetical protein
VRTAFRNYFTDARDFLEFIDQALEETTNQAIRDEAVLVDANLNRVFGLDRHL